MKEQSERIDTKEIKAGDNGGSGSELNNARKSARGLDTLKCHAEISPLVTHRAHGVRNLRKNPSTGR